VTFVCIKRERRRTAIGIIWPTIKTSLHMSYLPFAQQHKKISETEREITQIKFQSKSAR